ncbi:MAG TPA: hypothetical protein IAC95_04190 [Candidatus Fimimonas gallinarum]|uniref:Glutamate racemase n=1 Tax=Candidatus Fimimonas gallinarum TaxID=2840821 RepID=A0A9D1E3Y5_9BACT|nr:hypothetical protein [Candidatus Fimimonas gallinarum]
MKIAIIDDGVGAFATLNKLKYGLYADYTVKILDNHFPLGNFSRQQLCDIALHCVEDAVQQNFDTVVFSSTALSMAAVKNLSSRQDMDVFGCDAPILHASTYTASQVLVVGDKFVARASSRFPNVIPLALEQFPVLAERADEREIVSYIEDATQNYYGKFDCIALGNSSMNLYKHCFSRVFPNTHVFDSLEGVARKLRKKYKKNLKEESTVKICGEKGVDLQQKYHFFVDELQIAY